MKTRFAASAFFVFLFSVSAWAGLLGSDEMTVVEPAKAKWVTPEGLPKCASMTVLKGDPEKGAATLYIKAGSKCTIPWHWHTATETVMMVSGVGQLEMKDGKSVPWKAGNYVSMPGKHVHQAKCVVACTAFITTDDKFDIHYVNDKGDEITPDEALKKKSAK